MFHVKQYSTETSMFLFS